ncbi:hypothetical protein D3C86_2011320 [compost metagenome]
MLEALQIPFHLFIPERQLETERRRLRMNAMRTAHHSCIFILNRLLAKNRDKALDVFFENGIRLQQQVASSCIDNVS